MINLQNTDHGTESVSGQDIKAIWITIYQAIGRQMQILNQKPQKPILKQNAQDQTKAKQAHATVCTHTHTHTHAYRHANNEKELGYLACQMLA